MRFGVQICPKCNRALGVDLRFKSTKCPYCSRRLKIYLKNIQHTYDSERDLAAAISKLNEFNEFNEQLESGAQDGSVAPIKQQKNHPMEHLKPHEFDIDASSSAKKDVKFGKKGGSPQVYEHLDPFKRIAIKYRGNTKTIQSLKQVVTALGQELGELSSADLRRLFEECMFTESDAETYIEQLKDLCIIYEPRPGRFRIVDEE